MAGGKLPPRQKMIGMMYLVLTALLAMNVSKDILNAFVTVNDGLESTKLNFKDKNADAYSSFSKSNSENPVKTGPYYKKALEIKEAADQLVTHIDDIKVVKSKEHKDTIDLENGYFIKMKYPTMSYIMNKKDSEDKSLVDSTFEYAVECVEQIYNEEETWEAADSTTKEISEFIENLNSKQYGRVQEFFATMPKLTHTVKVSNPNTKVKSDVTIEGLANFFA